MTLARILLASMAMSAACGGMAWARDNIILSGSSAVLPYATIVAEAFGEDFDFPTPVVEGGGSGAGRKKPCEGLGEATIDIANSWSRITQGDLDACKANGVTDIMDLRYPVSRPLYVYAKKQHIGVTAGLKEFIAFFVSDDMSGADGVLAHYGLVPNPQLAATEQAVANGVIMGPLL